MANLSREALLIDITVYNLAMEIQWEKKAVYSLSCSLTVCKHCGRKHSICCICNKAVERWNATIQEVKSVSLRSAEGQGIGHSL
jgi:hypothetical protein